LLIEAMQPYFREAGSGEAVVCIHSNAATSGQWRSLMELLSAKRRVIAPDSLGAGKSPGWPQDRVVMLGDELALLEPVFSQAGNPMSLVGHSYGGAVALLAALAMPHRVRALAVYEPTLFSLLGTEAPGQLAAAGIRDTVAEAGAAVDANDLAAAGARFIDYWMGEGAWRSMPESRQVAVAASMINVRDWGHALFNEPTPLQSFGALAIPVLCMVGARSPLSSRAVSRLLTGVIRNVTVIEFPDLGHMGPLTHPALVNEAIARFLETS
jgi:pimeloyl-ACP methyl ester carboxylesterase